MELKYDVVAGGHIKLEITSMVACKRFLTEDPTVREEMWEANRIKLIKKLSSTEGLPFGLAMQNIKKWQEREYQRPPEALDYWWGLHDEERPVYFLTVVWIGRFEYLKEEKVEPVGRHHEGGTGEEAGGVGGGAEDGR